MLKSFTTVLLVLLLCLFNKGAFAQFTKLENFDDNPGNLTSSYFAAKTASPDLVVLLHGCAQEGQELAKQSGLLGLARKHNFSVLIPQQSLDNNIKRCFNWYSADDYAKNSGENLSIKNMILTAKQQLNSENIYIIGLSGGGAMASSLLVNYPELFNGGAIVAGIPFPCADGLITAISCMKNGPSQTTEELTELVKKLNPQQKNWPKLSVWTGKKDGIVNPLNSISLAQHWASLSGLSAEPEIKTTAGYRISTWNNQKQDKQVELIVVANLGHGIMVNPNEENGGEIADYLLASPISTVKNIIKFWQLPSMSK